MKSDTPWRLAALTSTGNTHTHAHLIDTPKRSSISTRAVRLGSVCTRGAATRTGGDYVAVLASQYFRSSSAQPQPIMMASTRFPPSAVHQTELAFASPACHVSESAPHLTRESDKSHYCSSLGCSHHSNTHRRLSNSTFGSSARPPYRRTHHQLSSADRTDVLRSAFHLPGLSWSHP